MNCSSSPSIWHGKPERRRFRCIEPIVRHGVLLAALLLPGCDSAQGKGSGAPVEHGSGRAGRTVERLVRCHREFVEGPELGLPAGICEGEGHRGHDRAVARRIVDAGPQRDRGTGSRRGDAGDSDPHASHERAGLIHEGWEDQFPTARCRFRPPSCSWFARAIPSRSRTGPTSWRRVEVITPKPKTSGNGKLSFLAAWEGGVQGGTEAKARNMSPGCTNTCRCSIREDARPRPPSTEGDRRRPSGLGERRAYFELAETGGSLRCRPSLSIRAEPRVAVVDANVDCKGSAHRGGRLLSLSLHRRGQEIIAGPYRPTTAEILARHSGEFAKVKLFPIQAIAKSWNEANTKIFWRRWRVRQYSRRAQKIADCQPAGKSYCHVEPQFVLTYCSQSPP